jgi:thiol-disulfide isomerase/thioredoxin
MNLIRLVLVIAILLPACALAGTPTEAEMEFSFSDLQGQSHRLMDFHGKIVVVNFWATWCGPCKHEMPLFVEAAKRYGEDRVQVIAVSLDDDSTRSKIPEFAGKQKMSFPILLGNAEVMQKLGLGEGLPATAFLDANGQVIARILGEVSKSELKARLDWMLGLKSGEAPPAMVNNLNKKRDEEITVMR